MATPTRFPYGVTNVAKSNPLGQFGMLDPTQWHVYFNDFDTYNAADWTITTTEAGAGSATEALTDIDGGALLITNDSADNDNDFFQKIGESFKMEAGKKAFFKARFKVSDATQSDVVIGLQVTDTTPLDVTDGIYFLKADDAATISVICRKDASTGSTSASAIATLSDDTFVTVAWYYDGKDAVAYYIDDVHLGTLDGSSTYLPDTELTVSFGIQNGAAAAKTMTLDYVFAAKQR
ncbi:hypothetical protein [Novosphingobium sp. KN65.2]|uniref:hypothetical protein n=1 Tax=Novosphingobium sp. KN65.2 TaxID=1478134 RepID=UPI0005E2BE30|nr:hypothetical protein [Novosphingobium sp. KN65.2]CDO34435.1 hypothetical protein SPHV1_1570008 [Novosphingobium sp. KN65.2]